MNLVKELGMEYFQDRCRNSMFFDENKRSCYIGDEWGGAGIPIYVVSGTTEKPVTTQERKGADFFTDLSVFSTPPLGWRMAAEGRYLAYFRRNNRSYHRGVAHHVLTRTVSPASQYLMETDNLSHNFYEDRAPTAHMVMQPSYISFRQGIEAMRQGELFSFAASPIIAVLPDVNGKQAVYFNTTHAATVSPEGEIECGSPAIMSLIKELK